MLHMHGLAPGSYAMLDRWVSIGSLWGALSVYCLAMFKLWVSATRMRHLSVE